jgi:superoxide reductase
MSPNLKGGGGTMGKQGEVYKCNVCNQVVEVIVGGAGELVCCGEPMKLQEEKSSDEGLEKHVPVLEQSGEGTVVKVGSVPHPMEESHYITMIELESEGNVMRKFLKPGEKPEAEFPVKGGKAREYCNIHGLWKSEKE